jgi:hypothetical protein
MTKTEKELAVVALDYADLCKLPTFKECAK